MNTLKIFNPATATVIAEPPADDAASVAAKAAVAVTSFLVLTGYFVAGGVLAGRHADAG